MAQVLKEEVKNRIIKAAKIEFLEKGYKEATLRKIALKAHITVGNLYRYFNSKEELIGSICGPCLMEIEELIKKETDNQLSFFKDNDNLDINKEIIVDLITNVIAKLIDIYALDPIEFKILMLDSKLNHALQTWFSKLIYNLFILFLKSDEDHLNEIKLMAKCYTIAIIAGFKELLNQDIEIYTLKHMAVIYFRSYVYMLNNNMLVKLMEK